VIYASEARVSVHEQERGWHQRVFWGRRTPEEKLYTLWQSTKSQQRRYCFAERKTGMNDIANAGIPSAHVNCSNGAAQSLIWVDRPATARP